MENSDWFDESQFVPTSADRLPAADIDELFEQAFDNPGYRAELNRRLPDSYLIYLLADGPNTLDRYHMRLAIDGEEVQQLMVEMQPVLRAFMLRGEGFELWSKAGDDDIAAYMRQQGAIYERV